ncbi:MAG TPA: ABC transporter substrate-binding protein [Acidimicrobiia bacterium]|nr:ABC transporter substrate-binding protein [Acidimicrobiia bacterium]
MLVLALIVAACAQDDTTDTTTGSDEVTTTVSDAPATTEPTTAPPVGGGSVSTYIGEPRSITTGNATESEGAAVMAALYTTLVGLDDNGDPEMQAAESVETNDGGATWVVTIKDGWTFHDGTPVTAQSYVDSWNYTALGQNAQQGAGFMSNIAGYADLQCGTVVEQDEETGEDVDVADCENQPPAAETLSGLTVDSDTQFTVSLSTPESFFAIRLVYDPYNPYPESFYDDPAAFGEMPIGQGPFMMAEPWSHNQSITLSAFPEYAGDNPAQIDTLVFQIFDDIDTALNELLAGNLDIHDGVTPERAAEIEAAVPGFGTAESSSINFLGIPWYDPAIGGDENRDLRAALSMAIDRQAITEAIFDGRRQPAYNLLSPVIPGFDDTVCPAWSFDPEGAAELYAQTDGLPASFAFWFNSGAAHEDWIEAVTNQWAQNLGIDVTGVQFESLDFADYLQRLEDRQVSGPFRLGWGMDYPHPQNYLQLILDSRFGGDAGGANYGYYSNPDFDAKVDEALGVFDLNESLPVWQEAATIACEDVALIPMFYGQYDYAWNDTVSNVSVDQFGNPRWTDLVATG